MLCVSGQRSLDYYFNSVQNAVTKVTSFAEKDLDSVDSEEQLAAHMERTREYFGMMASKTIIIVSTHRSRPRKKDSGIQILTVRALRSMK